MRGPAGTGPGQQLAGRPGVDDPLLGDAALLRPGASVDLPVELARGVGICVDREEDARLDGLAQQSARRVQPLRAAVDLHGGARGGTGAEHLVGVEPRLRAAPVEQPPGAVPQHIDQRIADRRDHPAGHGAGVHAQLGVDRGHHHVEPVQQLRLLVQGAVEEDVDLDAGEQPERREPPVQLRDHLQLFAQPVRGQSAGHGQPGRVVREHGPVMAEAGRGAGHELDRRAPVRPVRMQMAVTAQGGAQRGPGPLVRASALGRRSALVLVLQLRQIAGHLSDQRLPDHLEGRRSDPLERPQRARGRPPHHLIGGQL